LHEASGRPPSRPEATAGLFVNAAAKPGTGRQGTKTVSGHFDPAVSRQLRQIGLDHDKTVQEMLAEALNDLFIKHKMNPIA